MRAVGVGLMILGACCFAGCIAILGGCEPGAEYWPPQRVKVVERVVVERTMDPDTYLYAVRGADGSVNSIEVRGLYPVGAIICIEQSKKQMYWSRVIPCAALGAQKR